MSKHFSTIAFYFFSFLLSCRKAHYFIDAVVRAGMSSNVTENQQCGLPASPFQSQTGAVIEFLCDPPVLAQYVSVDKSPSSSQPVVVLLGEVTVVEYTAGECTDSSSPTVTEGFQQTDMSMVPAQTEERATNDGKKIMLWGGGGGKDKQNLCET